MSGHDTKLEVETTSSGKTYDHHGEVLDNTSLKGIARHINSSTVRGRSNVAKITVFGILGFIMYKKVSNAFSGDSKKKNTQDSVINAESA